MLLMVKFKKSSEVVSIKFDVHQNKNAIYLSTFAEPPQFAIWIENAKTGERKTVFVTHRSGIDDWEGKPKVPAALPRWSELFKAPRQSDESDAKNDPVDGVTGATPRNYVFSAGIEVPSGSEWNCWIEMNLAGDFNEAFPEFNEKTFEEDEFSCGQPALLYKANVIATKGLVIKPDLVNQSVWDNGENRIEPVSDGITTARNIFEDIKISVIDQL